MLRYENECVDCGLPCLGNSCPNRNVPRYYCDKCGCEETLYDYGGLELCADCIEQDLKPLAVTDENAVCEQCGETEGLYDDDGEILCLSCYLDRLDKVAE